MSTEEKGRRLRRLVPPWSFLTRLRWPYLFSRKRKDRGEKSAWRRVWCFLRLNIGWSQCFSCLSTRWSPYEFLTTRRLIRWVSNLELVALETVAVNRRCGGEPDGSYLLAGQIVRTKKKIQCKKMQANKSGLHLLFPANIQTQLPPNHVPTYQAARTRTYVR